MVREGLRDGGDEGRMGLISIPTICDCLFTLSATIYLPYHMSVVDEGGNGAKGREAEMEEGMGREGGGNEMGRDGGGDGG